MTTQYLKELFYTAFVHLRLTDFEINGLQFSVKNVSADMIPAIKRMLPNVPFTYEKNRLTINVNKNMFTSYGISFHVNWSGERGTDQWGTKWEKRNGCAVDENNIYKFDLSTEEDLRFYKPNQSN